MVRQAVSNEAGAAHGQTTRRKSAVWKDFDYVDVPGASAMATCKRCGTTLTACPKRHGTSHLRRHAGSSCCTTRAAERVAPCLPAVAPAGDDDDDEEVWAEMVEELRIDPESEVVLFLVDEQLDTGTSAGSPFTEGSQVDGATEVAVAGDHDRRSPNCMPDTRMPQVPSLSCTLFFQKKRERSAYLASQGGTTDKDHSSRFNTDWEPTVDNSMVYTDFTFGDAYD